MNESRRPWTRRERALLLEVYGSVPAQELQQYFPDRTVNACIKQAKYLRDRGCIFKNA
jgi:hypothetical protein